MTIEKKDPIGEVIPPSRLPAEAPAPANGGGKPAGFPAVAPNVHEAAYQYTINCRSGAFVEITAPERSASAVLARVLDDAEKALEKNPRPVIVFATFPEAVVQTDAIESVVVGWGLDDDGDDDEEEDEEPEPEPEPRARRKQRAF